MADRPISPLLPRTKRSSLTAPQSTGRRGQSVLGSRQMAKTAQVAGQDMPFEEALKKLESIVGSMEADELPLEGLLSRFEEGTRLAKMCQQKLSEAELKIQKLEKNSADEFVLK